MEETRASTAELRGPLSPDFRLPTPVFHSTHFPMLTILVLFVGLTLATAVIAYWSDNLGKKLGKKRVSLWGMRPRTSATFLTIASSWAIMVFTLAVMLGLFAPLRRALLRYDEVVLTRDKLQTRVSNLDARLKRLQTNAADASRQLELVQLQLTGAKRAATEAGKTRDDAQAQAQAAKDKAAQARARETQAEQRAEQARANLAKVSRERDATQQQRDAAQQDFSAAQAQLQKARAQVATANNQVASATARANRADADAQRADRQYQTAQGKLTRVQLDLTKAQGNVRVARNNERQSQDNARAAEQRARAAGQRALSAGRAAVSGGKAAINAEKQAILARNQVYEAQAQLDDLQAQAQKLEAANAKLAADVEEASQKGVRVPNRYILVARSFEATPSVTEAREALHAMFERAALFVTGDPKDKLPALLPGAQLQLSQLSLNDGKTSIDVSASDIYSELANQIAHSSGPLSVRLVAARNHREGDTELKARFEKVKIAPALEGDAELASATMDGRQSDAALFSALLRLADRGIVYARSQGVAPPLSPEVPDFYAPGTNEQLFKTLRIVGAVDGPTRVRILTLQPISTADQLRVRFEIEPLGAVPTTTANASLAPRDALVGAP